MRLLAWLIGIIIGWSLTTSTAGAVATSAGSNHAGQYTSPTNGSESEYYGWRGVKGYIYWHDNGQLNESPPGTYVHVDSWLGAKSSAYMSWVFAGITVDTPNYPVAQLFVENVLYGEQRHLTYYSPLWTPGSMFVKIESTGYRNPTMNAYKWDVLFGNGDHAQYNYIPTETGCMKAFGESYNAGGYNVLPRSYFGTNRNSYNTSGYALRLQRGDLTWELWDADLLANLGTGVNNSDDPPYRYSLGRPYYYFATITDW